MRIRLRRIRATRIRLEAVLSAQHNQSMRQLRTSERMSGHRSRGVLERNRDMAVGSTKSSRVSNLILTQVVSHLVVSSFSPNKFRYHAAVPATMRAGSDLRRTHERLRCGWYDRNFRLPARIAHIGNHT